MTERKATLYVATNGENETKEYEGTVSFTDGMQEADERIFQFVAMTETGQYTLNIPLEVVLAEIRRSLRGQ
jgi:hypothetical protein